MGFPHWKSQLCLNSAEMADFAAFARKIWGRWALLASFGGYLGALRCISFANSATWRSLRALGLRWSPFGLPCSACVHLLLSCLRHSFSRLAPHWVCNWACSGRARVGKARGQGQPKAVLAAKPAKRAEIAESHFLYSTLYYIQSSFGEGELSKFCRANSA